MGKPRIRSIKPEFWTDGSNLALSDSCALFFIGLWNFCDDEGKHSLDLNQLVAELGGRWHRGKVKLFVSCLLKSGQLRINSTSTWIQVVGWSHQRIDKPKQPDVKSSEIQWLDDPSSYLLQDDSRSIHARIGSDRIPIGSDRISSAGVQAPATAGHRVELLPAVKSKSGKAPRGEPATGPAWIAYSESYRERYGADPVRNATVNSQMANFVKRIGVDESPLVARFYIFHNDQFYVRSLHPVSLLLRDAEKLRTEWATRVQMTSGKAKDVERKQTNLDVFAGLIAEAEEKAKHGQR